ncbi:MAG: Nre family DNA repair protein [Candidatus Micrarchaeaceae archaeon]
MVGEMQVARTGTVYKNMKDPAFLKYFYRSLTIDKVKGNDIYGSSPPDLFVGRIGYPNVYIGPLVPPELGDTTVMGSPEMWVGKSMEDIVRFRSNLVRGMYKTRISNAGNGRIEEMIAELAMADKYRGVEEMLKHKPIMEMQFSENSQPYGPSAMMNDMRIDNSKANPIVESAYFDTDMNATKAIIELYDKGVMVSKIQKSLSAGILGLGGNRRFVPTRWSITAVDDTLSKYKLKSVKEYEALDHIEVYENFALDNRWLVIMIPGSWEYELVEAWYPNTSWNMESKNIEIYSSYEPFKGRAKYAEIGGCYYAARLASTELLDKMQRQARVVILREALPGYIMPVGVWNVREHVRQALRNTPVQLNTFDELLAFIGRKMLIPVNNWIKNSTLLTLSLKQKRLA